MLSTQIQILEKRIAAIEDFLRLYDFKEKAVGVTDASLQSILSAASIKPGLTLEDRAFRHCSVITNLYAIYEHFVTTALSLWLSRIPRYYRFSGLPDSLKNKYRTGISRLIRDIQRRQFGHLSLDSVIENYHKNLKDETPWHFVHEALTIHEANLRHSEINELFGASGIINFWQHIEADPEVKSQADLIDSQISAERHLSDFINYRNDASHGVMVDELLGQQPLSGWISFIKAICLAMNRALTINVLMQEKKYVPNCVVGCVSEKFSNNIVVAKLKAQQRIRSGDLLFFLKPRSYVFAEVLSIQVDNVAQTDIVSLADGFEVGLQISQEVQEDADVISLVL